MIEYQGEGYFDPWMIVLFRVTLHRRRGEAALAADYLSQIEKGFASRFKMVSIKLRLLECKLRSRQDVKRARQLAEWLVSETRRLQIPRREIEAEAIAMSLH